MPFAANEPSSDLVRCEHCNAVSTPWTTTCIKCGFSAKVDEVNTPLADQLAAPLTVSPAWIDVAISAEEPAKVALLGQFLTENEITFEQSRRFVSIPAHYGDDLADRIHRWAFHGDMVEDQRSPDSLAATMREIGMAVIGAIIGDMNAAEEYTEATPGAIPRIDLR